MKSSKPNSITAEKTQYHAEILSNRVRNRFAHFSKRFKKQGIDCFRLYDWDIKEIRAVVDWYAGHAVIGEYVRWQTGDHWLPEMAKAVAAALSIPPKHVHIKRRQTKTEEGPRYSKMSRPFNKFKEGGIPLTFYAGKAGGSTGERFKVRERDLNFWVNLDDFLDTGLFSDHRDTRSIIKKLSQGQDFLNLFAYTGAFSCAAASGGAKTTVTVDRSETYIKWARENLKLNALDGPQHSLIQSDAFKYLDKAYREGRRFTLALVDPPSFSQDQGKKVSFDINADHPDLLRKALTVMLPGSTLFFSTNHQRFEPRLEGLPVKDLAEITPATIPEDYRNRQIHRCWRMTVL